LERESFTLSLLEDLCWSGMEKILDTCSKKMRSAQEKRTEIEDLSIKTINNRNLKKYVTETILVNLMISKEFSHCRL